jgi:transposase
MHDTIFVGIHVHKATISIAVAGGARWGVRQLGNFLNCADHVGKLVERLSKAGGQRLRFCYEAGPCGYGLHRQITALGHECVVVAPSLIPMKAGDRIETDRRDAVMLAKLHRAGELTAVWVPDAAHEAMRDLIRARATTVRVLGKARQYLQGFLLRHGRVYAGKKGGTLPYRRWLTTIRFDQPARQVVLQDYIHSVHDAEERIARLTKQIKDLVPTWSMAPVVEAFQANAWRGLRGGSHRRCESGRFHPLRQSAPGDGLPWSDAVRTFERDSTRRGGITKAGNALARRVLIEGAWTYRMQARVSRKLHDRRGISTDRPRHRPEAQVRLCPRYRRLVATGKPKVVVTTAIAREMAGFLWAIARQTQIGSVA